MATWHESRKEWVASCQIQGKRQFFRSKISAEDADAKARKQPPSTHHFDEGSFAAFVYGPWKSNVWPDLRPKSKDKYNGALRCHILPVLGHLPLSSIGLDEMLALKASLVLKGKKTPGAPMHNRTAHGILTLALSILDLAKKSGKTQREDWALVQRPKFKKKTAREMPENFTKDILGAAAGSWMAGPLFAALFLGLRLGEVCGLKWSAINRQTLTVKIDSQRQRQTGRGTVDAPTKSYERTLYVNQELIAWLDKLGNRGSIYVFTGSTGIPMRPDKVTQSMPGLCKRAKIEKTEFRALRSYAATNLVELGADLPVVMSILGHTKVDTTMLYVNTKKAKVREALGKLLTVLNEQTG